MNTNLEQLKRNNPFLEIKEETEHINIENLWTDDTFMLRFEKNVNFSDLSEEAQNRLLENSKKDVERKFGDDIRKYVRENYTCFETMVEEEALRNLYSYTFIFNV